MNQRPVDDFLPLLQLAQIFPILGPPDLSKFDDATLDELEARLGFPVRPLPGQDEAFSAQLDYLEPSLKRLREALSDVRAAQSKLADHTDTVSPRLAIPKRMPEAVFSKALTAYNALKPLAPCELVFADADEIEALLLDSAVDMAVGYNKFETRKIVSHEFVKEPMRIVCRHGYPFKKPTKLAFGLRWLQSAEYLEDETFVLVSSDAAGKEDLSPARFRRVCFKLGIGFPTRQTALSSLEEALYHVRDGQGITFAPHSVVEPFLASGELEEIRINGGRSDENSLYLTHSERRLRQRRLPVRLLSNVLKRYPPGFESPKEMPPYFR